MSISDLLFSSPCFADGVCRNPNCDHAVAEYPETNRWFILFGHAGFNSPTNNASGYETKELALKSMRYYLKK